MATAYCERFPEGEAHIRTTAGIVLFQDGVAVVESPELVEALREVPDEFGITVEGAADLGAAPTLQEPTEQPPTEQPAEPGKRPAQAAPKADWVAWAAAHGMDADQADDLTKAQLIELADQLAKE